MDTKKLRQKILDLAIRGKLVPQDPNDEPASVLLERIRAEKERLIKEGKIKRNKKSASDTPHYENVPFKIPETWEWCQLDDLAFVTKLAGFEYTNYIADNLSKKDGIPLFKGKNVQDGNILYDFESYIPQSISNSLPRSQVSKKCLLTPYVGTIGNIGIHEREGIYHLGSNVGKIELFNENNINVYEEFVRYFLMSSYGYKELTKHKKATAQDSISIDAIRDVNIALPPTQEQRRIIENIQYWLSFVDEIGANSDAILNLVELSKSKILDLAIHGKLVLQDPNDEPAIELLKRINPNFTPCDNAHKRNQIPDSWILCTLQDSFEITMGTSPAGDTLNREKLGIEFHQGKVFFSNKYILPSDIYSTLPVKLAEPQSILLCVRAPVGTVNITDRQICIGRGLCSLKPSKSVDLQYAYYVLQTCSKELEQKATGSTFKAVVGDVVKKQTIPLPPINEQRRVVAKIEELFAVLDEIQKSIEA